MRYMIGMLLFLMTTPAWAAKYHKDHKAFRPGDELWSIRKMGKLAYHHAGIYIGNGMVVHVDIDPRRAPLNLIKGKSTVSVQKVKFRKFSLGKPTKVGPSKRRYKRSTIVKRVLARVGKLFLWKPLTRNCQHWSSSFVSGKAKSPEGKVILKVLAKSAKWPEKKVKEAFNKTVTAIKGKNNTTVRIKNCSKKKVYVCVYNGGDKARVAPKKIFSLDKRKSARIDCTDNGKKRCQVRLSKRKKCVIFLKTYSIPKNKLRYVKYSRGKFSLSMKCR